MQPLGQSEVVQAWRRFGRASDLFICHPDWEHSTPRLGSAGGGPEAEKATHNSRLQALAKSVCLVDSVEYPWAMASPKDNWPLPPETSEM